MSEFENSHDLMSNSLLVDCRWGCWDYTNCTVECGSGYVFQRREIWVSAKDGGNNCSGDPYRITNIKCNTEACPGKYFKNA